MTAMAPRPGTARLSAWDRNRCKADFEALLAMLGCEDSLVCEFGHAEGTLTIATGYCSCMQKPGCSLCALSVLRTPSLVCSVRLCECHETGHLRTLDRAQNFKGAA